MRPSVRPSVRPSEKQLLFCTIVPAEEHKSKCMLNGIMHRLRKLVDEAANPDCGRSPVLQPCSVYTRAEAHPELNLHDSHLL